MATTVTHRWASSKDEELAREIVGIARAKEALRDERSAAENALMATLMRSRPPRRLAKSWPEGLPFYQGFLGTTASVPAVRFADINAIDRAAIRRP